MTTKFETPEAYYAAQPEEARAALQRLRNLIRETVPETQEYIYYQILALKFEGKPLLAYGGFKNHLSLFTLSNGVMKQLQDDLRAYEVKGVTIKFTADNPLPAGLVRKMVNRRMREIRELNLGKKKKPV